MQYDKENPFKEMINSWIMNVAYRLLYKIYSSEAT